MIWKYILSDLARVILLILISFVIALGVNGLRSTPIPLRFEQQNKNNKWEIPFFVSTNNNESNEVFNFVSLKETQQLQKTSEVILLDARAKTFYNEGHIPGAFNLSRKDFESDLAHLLEKVPSLPDKNLIVYCSNISCQDSEQVAQKLKEFGFGRVAIFKGGWEEWEINGLPKETTP